MEQEGTNGEDVFTFDCLPEEITLDILGFLTGKELCAARLVCKSWRRVCDDPILWRRLSLNKYNYELPSRERYVQWSNTLRSNISNTESNALRMTVVTTDGGQYSLYYKARRLLYLHGVYCTGAGKSSNVNVVFSLDDCSYLTEQDKKNIAAEEEGGWGSVFGDVTKEDLKIEKEREAKGLLITRIFIKTPSLGFTCPVSHGVIFTSNQYPDIERSKVFDNCSNEDTFQQIMKDHWENNGPSDYCPLSFFSVHHQHNREWRWPPKNATSLHFPVCRYVHVKYIGSTLINSMYAANIDIDYTLFGGFVINRDDELETSGNQYVESNGGVLLKLDKPIIDDNNKKNYPHLFDGEDEGEDTKSRTN